MLKILEKKDSKRRIHIIIRSPNQYPNCRTYAESKPVHSFEGSLITFDDMVGARNSSQIDEILTRRRREDSDVYLISQSYFGLLRQSVRNNSDSV